MVLVWFYHVLDDGELFCSSVTKMIFAAWAWNLFDTDELKTCGNLCVKFLHLDDAGLIASNK